MLEGCFEKGMELLHLKHLEQYLAQGKHNRFARYDILLPFYTFFFISTTQYSIKSEFFPIPLPPTPQFIKHIPDFILTQTASRGFQVTLHISYLFF